MHTRTDFTGKQDGESKPPTANSTTKQVKEESSFSSASSLPLSPSHVSTITSSRNRNQLQNQPTSIFPPASLPINTSNHQNNVNDINEVNIINQSMTNRGGNSSDSPVPSSISQFSITVSTISTLMFANFPAAFNDFTSNELVCSVTNFLARHILSFREAKALNIPDPTDVRSMFYSVTEPSISLRYYVNRHVTYGKYAPIHFIMAMIYIDRLARKDVALIPSGRNVHRILTAALAIAVQTRVNIDEEHTVKVAGFSSTQELRKIIDTFLRFIDHNTSISTDDMQRTFTFLDTMKNLGEIQNVESMSTVTDVHDGTESESTEVISEQRNASNGNVRMYERSESGEQISPPSTN